MRRVRFAFAALLTTVAVAAAGCKNNNEPAPTLTPAEAFPTSLHATGRGKPTFYEASDGFRNLTSVSYTNLSCKGCHQPLCTNCHVAEGDSVPDAKCLTCHSRQAAEVNQGYSDVHRAAGMGCMSCHTGREMHGDGTEYASMLAPGAMDARCETCHTTLATNAYHTQHRDDVACASCHMQSVVTCNNCHFDSEIATPGTKRPTGQYKNWFFLVNRNGKVHPANYQSLVYQNSSFVAFAPFYSHTIARRAVTNCNTCHNNANVQQYQTNHVLPVVTYSAGTNTLSHPTGILPIPADWQTSLTFDFQTWNGTAWQFLRSGTNGRQMLYATPLTATQMSRLAMPH